MLSRTAPLPLSWAWLRCTGSLHVNVLCVRRKNVYLYKIYSYLLQRIQRKTCVCFEEECIHLLLRNTLICLLFVTHLTNVQFPWKQGVKITFLFRWCLWQIVYLLAYQRCIILMLMFIHPLSQNRSLRPSSTLAKGALHCALCVPLISTHSTSTAMLNCSLSSGYIDLARILVVIRFIYFN